MNPAVIYNGTDIVEVERIRQALERHGERFLRRVFTDNECTHYANRPASLAARWAAKEAVAKLLGVGLLGLGGAAQRPSAQAISLHEVEVLNEPNGKPQLRLFGRAAAQATTMGIYSISISLSHTNHLAIAHVVALAVPSDQTPSTSPER